MSSRGGEGNWLHTMLSYMPNTTGLLDHLSFLARSNVENSIGKQQCLDSSPQPHPGGQLFAPFFVPKRHLGRRRGVSIIPATALRTFNSSLKSLGSGSRARERKVTQQGPNATTADSSMLRPFEGKTSIFVNYVFLLEETWMKMVFPKG